MGAHFRYLSYVVRHKWFVLVAGLKTGAPLWRLIIHDWSKFLPCEWFPYVRKFYGPKHPPHSSEWWKVREEFDRAWLHHQHANAHHWQHWVLREDDGATKVLPMPERLVREMVADWAGAGRAITGRWDIFPWYTRTKAERLLHPETLGEVEHLLGTVTFG